MVAILDFNYSYLNCFKNYMADNWNLCLLPHNLFIELIFKPYKRSRIFSKGYHSTVWRAIELNLEILFITPKYIIGTYFYNQSSMFILALTALKEGDQRPPEGPIGLSSPLQESNERVAECPKLLIVNNPEH